MHKEAASLLALAIFLTGEGLPTRADDFYLYLHLTLSSAVFALHGASVRPHFIASAISINFFIGNKTASIYHREYKLAEAALTANLDCHLKMRALPERSLASLSL